MEISVAFKSKPTIVFNGCEYRGVEDMPADVRRQYQDALALAAKGGPNVKVSSHTEIVFNGRQYNSVDEMPPEARLMYGAAMKTMDANRNGIPDVLEGGGLGSVSPRRSLFSVVSVVSLIILFAWLVIILLRRV